MAGVCPQSANIGNIPCYGQGPANDSKSSEIPQSKKKEDTSKHQEAAGVLENAGNAGNV